MSWLEKLFGTIERDNEASQEIKLDPTANQNVVIDPKVAEYFKDFPDPYREKVVQRYSKREGIYQLDFFRDQAMLNERKMVSRGIFQQDRIEHEHKLKEIEEQERKVQDKERIQKNLEREIPEWEKTLQQYIPLQADDIMALKLFQTINLSLIGASLIWVSLSVTKK
ncbi:unnamed protein product [Lymnaea stagnalis]|uniref:Uncharacterized protein n=1 Tax=Lymnaea stagnalis TaxID=6523 RepID=A0AAV2HR49_LYMST